MKKQISVSMIVVLLVALVGMSSTSAWAQPPIPTANLALWLAGDNVNGDSTNPANGAQVTTWVDLSGNGSVFASWESSGELAIGRKCIAFKDLPMPRLVISS